MTTWTKDLLLLTLIIGTFFGATLGNYPLSAPDGARYAEIPREMVATSDYITPHLNGVKYFEKPPLFYWLQAASIKTFGATDLGVSIPNALLALGCVLLIYLTGRSLYGRLQGMTASLIFATSSLVFALTRVVTLDMALTFFITGSLSSFLLATQLDFKDHKRTLYLWASYIFSALAVMTKGLVGMIFLGIIAIIWITICQHWRHLKTYKIISGLVLFLLITLPWHILVQIKNPEFLNFYFLEQHFLRYFTDYAGRSQKWWFFPVLLVAGMYPWTAFFPQTIYSCLRKNIKFWQQPKPSTFLLIWILVIYAFYSPSNSKLIPYILPIFPPIAILLGNYFVEYWQTKKDLKLTVGFNLLSAINLLFGIAAIAATFVLDFKEQAITKQNLYVTATIMLASSIIIFMAYRKRGTDAGFIAICLTSAILLFYLSPIISTVNRQSIKPLITTLQTKLKPTDEVITYEDYYQDLPFYLKRIVTVVNFTGELAFGMQNQDTSSWMIDKKTFWERWQQNGTKYMIVDSSYYPELKSIAPDKTRVIAKHLDTLLITNSN